VQEGRRIKGLMRGVGYEGRVTWETLRVKGVDPKCNTSHRFIKEEEVKGVRESGEP